MNGTRLLVTGFTKTKVSSVSVSLFPGLLGGGSFRPTFGIWIHRIKWRQYNFCLIKVSVWKGFLQFNLSGEDMLLQGCYSISRTLFTTLWDTYLFLPPLYVITLHIVTASHFFRIYKGVNGDLRRIFYHLSISTSSTFLFSFVPIECKVSLGWSFYISWEFHSLCVSMYTWVTKVLEVRNIKLRIPHFRYASINFQYMLCVAGFFFSYGFTVHSGERFLFLSFTRVLISSWEFYTPVKHNLFSSQNVQF